MCCCLGNREQIEVLDELMTHNRLRDLSRLASTLSQ